MKEKKGVGKGNDGSLKKLKAKLQLESVGNVGRVRVVVGGNGDDKQGISYKYEWFRNGIRSTVDSDWIDDFKRGDKIDVIVSSVADKKRDTVAFLSLTIAHVPPKIIDNNEEIDFDGSVLSHQVKAIDPDGGVLSYSLIDPPEGMAIDRRTGMIYWKVKSGDYGEHNVKVMIKSTNDTQTIYPLSINLGRVNQ